MRERLPAVAILLVGWTLFIAYAYPGVMSFDSFDQLHEARAGFFSDSHPPVMAALWGSIDRVAPGPFPLLIIQGTCFLIGVYLLLRRAMGRTAAAAWAVVLFLFPPIISPMAVIWKDCLMAGFLVLGIVAILDARPWMRLVGLGCLTMATALRYNALAATLPLVILLFEWRPGSRWRYALAFGVWLAVSAIGLEADALLVDREMHIWQSSLALTDIVGTTAMLDDDLPDDQLRPLLAPTGLHADHDLHHALRAHYKPGDFAQLIGGSDPLWTLPITGWTPAPADQREAITHAWRVLVLGHPWAYAEYRLDTVAEILGLRSKFNGMTVVDHTMQMPGLVASYHIPDGWPSIQRPPERLARRLERHTGLYRPYVYVLLALVLLPFAWRERDIAALLASGLVMELSLVPLAVTPDFRYSHWLVVTTCLSLVMLVARRMRR